MSKVENNIQISSRTEKPRVTKSIEVCESGPTLPGFPVNGSEDRSYPGFEALKLGNHSVEVESSNSELELSKADLISKGSYLESDILDFETLLESENISSSQGSSSTDNSFLQTQEDSQDVEMYQISNSEEGESSTSDDDVGDDYTVSKYMQSKISRLDEARFGVWKVERTESKTTTATGTDKAIADDGCVSNEPKGTWEVAGTSHSAEGHPPLKLTLKKSSHSAEPEELHLPKKKHTKKKHKTKQSPSEPKDPHKRRGPGRPPGNNSLPSQTTRQRLVKMFRKKYFRDRKRWARSNSTFSMPPTIRSIAKP